MIQQIPTPFLFIGDFNTHHPLWGCSSQDNKGYIIEQLLLLNSSFFLTPNSIHIFIQLLAYAPLLIFPFVVLLSLSLDYLWEPLKDLCGSDHFLILLTSTPLQASQHWKLNKAKWESFKDQRQSCINLSNTDIIHSVELFTDTLINTANTCIPKTSDNLSKRKKI